MKFATDFHDFQLPFFLNIDHNIQNFYFTNNLQHNNKLLMKLKNNLLQNLLLWKKSLYFTCFQ